MKSNQPKKVNTDFNTVIEKDTIISSKIDREVLFKALENPSGPTEKLLEAAEFYKKFIGANN